MVFPVVKLGYLAIKQVSKPLAIMIKRKAKDSPFLRNKVLQGPAQLYHRMETGFRMRMLGLGKVKEVKPLEPELAVELGAEMLGEIVLFTFGSFIIYLEYRRQANKDQGKEDFQNNRLVELEQTILDLGLQMDEQRTRISELSRLLHSQAVPISNLPSTIVDTKSGAVLQVQTPGR